MKIKLYNRDGSANPWYWNLWKFHEKDFSGSALTWDVYFKNILGNDVEINISYGKTNYIEFYNEEDMIAFMLRWS